jgi:hypothetical protein
MNNILKVFVGLLVIFVMFVVGSSLNNVGYSDVGAYPVPMTATQTCMPTSTSIPTPIHTPAGPMPPTSLQLDYVMVEPIGPSGAFDVVCGSCVGYAGGNYGYLGTTVYYEINGGGYPGHTTSVGYWIGNTSDGKPIYRAYPMWVYVFNGFYNGCVNFNNLEAAVTRLSIDYPYFYVNKIYSLLDKSRSYCIQIMPDILRDR